VKRLVICVVLVIVSIFCFWYALSGTYTPSPTANRGKAASPQSGTGGVSGGSTAGSSSAGGGAGINSARSSVTNSPMVASGTDNLSCRMQCQAGNSTCQGSCYQQYSVTNQTLFWSQCMQSCASNLNTCSTACAGGTAFSPTPVHAPAPAPAPAPVQPPLSAPKPVLSPPPS
jgi:hypothetical protein